VKEFTCRRFFAAADRRLATVAAMSGAGHGMFGARPAWREGSMGKGNAPVASA